MSRLLGLSWDAVDGIQSRAVARGLARRPQCSPERVGVDETSFQKRHEYVTVVNDLAQGVVLHVADSRGQEAFDGSYAGLGAEGCARLREVAIR